MSLNSAKNQRNIKFKEHYFPNKQVTKKNSNQITIIPFVKLKDVWFSKEQNKVVSSIYETITIYNN